jgi:hypothetical protein
MVGSFAAVANESIGQRDQAVETAAIEGLATRRGAASKVASYPSRAGSFSQTKGRKIQA